MHSLRISLKKIKVSDLVARPYFFPLVLLSVCLIAFAFLIPKLGFYWDDWPIIFVARHGDFSILQTFYLYDRPFLSFTYLLTVPILGTDPQNWQAFAMLLRFCVALSMWLVLRQVWPDRKFLAEGAALLFLVYPSFTEQSISVTYVPHFTAYVLFFLSLWFMLRAAHEPKKYLLFTAFALLAGAYHLFTVEYFTGLELIRPFVLFFMFREETVPVEKSWRKALLQWIPYLLLLLIFVAWRLFFATILEDPNSASLLTFFAHAPVNTAISLLQDVLRDFVLILFSVWQKTLNPELINLSDMSIVVSWGLGIFAALCVATYISKSSKYNPRGKERAENEWGAQAVGFGVLAVFLSMLPVHLIQKDLLTGLFADRLTMPAMFGAAIFWVGVAKLVLKSQFQRAILIAILVGLAVGMQIRTSHSYTLDWQKQTRIYWQLFWRAQSIEPNTPLVFSGALSGYVAEYAASAAINTLFDSPIENGRVYYWVFDYFDDFQGNVEDLAAKPELDVHQRSLYFRGSTSNAIFLHYSWDGQCLWLLNSNDAYNHELPSEFQNAAPLSDLGAVNHADEGQNLPNEEIFGLEPPHGWCYYFERMDLSRQHADWIGLLALWAEAQQNGYRPNNQVEMVPVIEALVQTKELRGAFDLSHTIIKRQPKIRSMLCSLWKQWIGTGSFPSDIGLNSSEILSELNCP